MARCSACRPGHRNSPRCFARARRGNSRGDGPVFAALRRLRLRNWPTPLAKPDWSDTTAAGCGLVCRARPCCHRVAALALRSAVVESEKRLALARLRPERVRQTRPIECWLRGAVGMKECFRDSTQHTLSVRSFLPHKFFSCRQLPAPGPFGPEFMSDNVPLCAAPLLHCHAHSRGRLP
jgi:hypothetical protein